VLAKFKFFFLNNIVDWSIFVLFVIINVINIIESSVICKADLKAPFAIVEGLFCLPIGYLLFKRIRTKMNTQMMMRNCPKPE